MGGLLYHLFRLLPSRGAPSGVSGQDQPSSFPQVGRCGSRQSGEAINGQIPPEAIQMRPIWNWGRHHRGVDGSPIVPSNSNPQIHCGEGPCSRGVLQAGCHAASSESMVHRATTGDLNSGRPSPTAVCRTQLPDWRGYYGCHRGSRGLHYPDTGPLA